MGDRREIIYYVCIYYWLFEGEISGTIIGNYSKQFFKERCCRQFKILREICRDIISRYIGKLVTSIQLAPNVKHTVFPTVSAKTFTARLPEFHCTRQTYANPNPSQYQPSHLQNKAQSNRTFIAAPISIYLNFCKEI